MDVLKMSSSDGLFSKILKIVVLKQTFFFIIYKYFINILRIVWMTKIMSFLSFSLLLICPPLCSLLPHLIILVYFTL